jgi:hypothetical protein
MINSMLNHVALLSKAPAPPTQCWAGVMVYNQKLFRGGLKNWTGAGGGETKFVLLMFNNFVILGDGLL